MLFIAYRKTLLVLLYFFEPCNSYSNCQSYFTFLYSYLLILGLPSFLDDLFG